MGVRLDRLLANLGHGSRHDVRVAVARGRVRVSGVVTNDSSCDVADPAEVEFDGAPLKDVGPLLVLLHKPLGYVCSHDTTEGPRVYDLLPTRWQARNPQVVTVGRLDKDSTGLVLLTDIHPLVHALTSPKRHVTKRYIATLDRPMTADVAERFAAGTVILRGEERPCSPAIVEPLGDTSVTVTIDQGRYHQVRRMFAACGFHVTALHRTGFGDYELADLDVGTWQQLDPTAPAKGPVPEATFLEIA